MASRMISLALRHQPAGSQVMIVRAASTGGMNPHLQDKLAKLGNRDVVGFGFNGEWVYQDRPDFPMPAIRFKENTPEILVSDSKSREN